MKLKTLSVIFAFATLLTACQTSNTNQSSSHLSPEKQQAELFNQAREAYQNKDYARAIKLFEQNEHMKAPRYLGLMYLNGEGVSKDPQRAFAYFRKATEKGDITGQYWLGYCYENGVGTDKNLAQAIEWYRKSAQRGDHVSQPAIDALKRLGIQSK